VTLVERYNCLGGLSTGGLVMWIDRMTDWQGNHVIQGFAREFIARMPPEAVAGPPCEDWGQTDPLKVNYWQNRTTAFHGIVQWAPTLDPERMKLNNQEMLLAAGVRLVFHAWAARPIVEDGVARGVVFESKAGRQALMAKVVVDTSGDGDMFARAGAEFDTDIEEGDVHHSMNTAWVAGGRRCIPSSSGNWSRRGARSWASSRRLTSPGGRTSPCGSGRASRAFRRSTWTT
jgi:hypothetical protein